MNRKEFIKNGILGSAIFATSASVAKLAENDIDELERLNVIGVNPHYALELRHEGRKINKIRIFKSES